MMAVQQRFSAYGTEAQTRAAVALQSSTPEPKATGLAVLKKQVDTIEVLHSEGQRRRLVKLRRIIRGAAYGLSASMQKEKKRYRVAFGTATYAQDDQWRPRHFSELMKHYQRWCKRRGIKFRYVWVAELTKKGRVHYHWCFWLPLGITPPKPDKQGWWKHGWTQVKWARKPAGYLIKYASKGIDSIHSFPKGCRIYGVGGDTGHLGFFRAPNWMRQWMEPGDKVLKKQGFWNNFTRGIGYRSPWMYHRSTAQGIILKWVGWSDQDVKFLYCE